MTIKLEIFEFIEASHKVPFLVVVLNAHIFLFMDDLLKRDIGYRIELVIIPQQAIRSRLN